MKNIIPSKLHAPKGRQIPVWPFVAAGVLALAAALSAENARSARPGGSRELWFFFSPSAKGLAREAQALGAFLTEHPEVVLRPCLLVKDWKDVAQPGSDLADTIAALRALSGSLFSLPLWDEEGLRLARALGIERLPAYALLDAPEKSGPRKARLAYGKGANLQELAR